MKDELKEKLYRLDIGDPNSKGCTITLGEYLRIDCPELENFISKLQQDLLTQLITECEGIEEYIVVKDNDTHRYQIPKSKLEDWEEFCEIPEDDERSWDVPDWAERIDGHPVKSFKDQVITLLKNKRDESDKKE